MLKDFLFYLIILLFLAPVYFYPQNAAFIGSPGTESDSAFFLLKNSFPSAQIINVNELSSQKFDLLWIHNSDSLLSPLASGDADKLKQYVASGGNLLLTLEAFRLVYDLGLENSVPGLKYVSASDEGYGRKLGFHAFIDHPVFSGLHGGAYVWNSSKDNITRMRGYFDDYIPNGQTVAVDWAYITLKENSRIIIEYHYGSGKVLAAGAYTYYSPENYNKEQLKKFTVNCFDYLIGKISGGNKYYWDYSIPEVKGDIKVDIKSSEYNSVPWDEIETLKINSLFASDNYWDLAGERILIMGKEKGGIDEVWIHPFMAFRDYELGIQFSYRDTIYWLNEERPAVEVSPAYLKRVYNFRRAFLTEIISADPLDPSCVIHYEYRGVYPARMFIKVKSNLRYMWPYSGNAFRRIRYGTDTSHIIFSTEPDYFSAIMGVNKRAALLEAGQYEDFIKKDSLFSGVSTDESQVSVLMAIDLKMNDNLDVSFAGSMDHREITDIFDVTASDPNMIYKRSVGYVNDFFKKNISVTTPDEDLNEGIKWAMIGSDKFFVNTPGVGKSLVAGYSTTARGWNGGHKINGRPGYAWYFGRDGEWSSFALLDYGDFEKVREVIKTYNRYQDLNGKIYHELTTSGAVHYDAADATPLYLILCGKYLRHSGDISFIKDNWNNILKAVEYCYSTDTDNDKLIENTNAGHGWVEGGSLYGAHTTLYLASCWAEALKEVSFMAKYSGFNELEEKYSADYRKVKEIINKNFWNESSGFFNYGLLKDGSFNHEKTVLPAVTLCFELADKDKALSMMDDFAGNGFTSDWGVRILSSESSLFNPAGYHYGSVWPLFTGWTSLGEYKYGNYFQGYVHMLNNLNIYKNFSRGYVEEVLNGAVYKPSGVCPHQCWSETMILQPLIEGMLGFSIDKMNNEIYFSPKFPADWVNAEVQNIRSGNETISFKMKKGKEISYYFDAGAQQLKMYFSPALPLLSRIDNVTLNGKEIKYELIRENQNIIIKTEFALTGKAELKISLQEGISLLPFIPSLAEGDSSTGLRVISANLDNNVFVIIVEGKPHTEPILKIYSPNNKIRCENKEVILSKSGNTYTAKILFEDAENYIRKNLRMVIE